MVNPFSPRMFLPSPFFHGRSAPQPPLGGGGGVGNPDCFGSRRGRFFPFSQAAFYFPFSTLYLGPRESPPPWALKICRHPVFYKVWKSVPPKGVLDYRLTFIHLHLQTQRLFIVFLSIERKALYLVAWNGTPKEGDLYDRGYFI